MQSADGAPLAAADADADASDATRAQPDRLRVADLLLLASFFISGTSALAYQVSWQRALYGQIGVDVDSITIIVSVFMLGIGIGGMAGGWLADRLPRHRLHLYGGIEFTIGVFGLASLALLPWLVDALGAASGGRGTTVAASFLFLLLPTVLMGMTLPLLTIAFDERRRNIGVSVGTLYFTNTLGAALGAALVPLVLLPRWPLPDVVLMAACGNCAVIACTLAAARATRQGR
jgi:predicted membrane-bound spermidine synthase